MNLDGYEVAYGEKPVLPQNPLPSDALRRVLSVFPRQAWDSAGFTANIAGAVPMPYAIIPRQDELKKTCGASLDDEIFSLEEPLRRMRLLRGSQEMTCGLADTAAWAHCLLAGEVRRVASKRDCLLDQARRQELNNHVATWRQEAAQLSPALVRTEARICSAWLTSL
eukprot:CAMPEP_0171120456 /NCGR_PEP_ID=MMETSP0766_2-20121228/99759_1 /TAXON_ID=439317 /ORGANISM="Gambierdiscus australes, Strain CAWD 149" /LENGTH=166 /DNA_ID=CAMNT_0011583187 /DNA_START=109 /DNA_END=609 /DNA_ORIENTATION=-